MLPKTVATVPWRSCKVAHTSSFAASRAAWAPISRAIASRGGERSIATTSSAPRSRQVASEALNRIGQVWVTNVGVLFSFGVRLLAATGDPGEDGRRTA